MLIIKFLFCDSRFPLDGDKALLEKWIMATGDSSFIPTDDSYLCSYHFKSHEIDFHKDVPTLKPGAYPTIVKTPVSIYLFKLGFFRRSLHDFIWDR